MPIDLGTIVSFDVDGLKDLDILYADNSTNGTFEVTESSISTAKGIMQCSNSMVIFQSFTISLSIDSS